jgi:hypothetical protein
MPRLQASAGPKRIQAPVDINEALASCTRKGGGKALAEIAARLLNAPNSKMRGFKYRILATGAEIATKSQ